MNWLRWILGVLIFGFLLAPVACWGIVLLVTSAFDCRVDEAGAYPCEIWGWEVGDPLAIIGIYAAWGALIFWPMAAGAGLLWGTVEIVRAIVRTSR